MAKAAKKAVTGAAASEQYLKALKHPLKAELQAIRKIILAADDHIEEEIKWNTLCFHVDDKWLTAGVRPGKNFVLIVLHRGAKVREFKAIKIDDPSGLLEWPAKDRAVVKFMGLKEVAARSAALRSIAKQWVDQT